MKHCPICSKELKIKTNESIIVKYKTSNGVKDILVKNISFSYCPHCGEFFYNKKETENYEIQLEKALEATRKCEGLLTAHEIKNIRKKYGLTQVQLEKLLDIGPKNVAKWETYRSNQSKNIDKILRIMDKDICFFVKLLLQERLDDFKNVYEKNALYVNNYPAVEFLTSIYPDISYKNITVELVNSVNNIIKETIKHNINCKNGLYFTCKEAI